MQKQKTIAKWLAVVLLLTVAIACYVALSAVLPQKTKNSDIAGANDSRPDETTEKVYSSFPRQSQSVDGAKINNVGGSDNDSLVATAYYEQKTLVFFKSDSSDRDVKNPGLYAACFVDGTLESVVEITGQNSVFLDCTPSKNGLAVFTSDGEKTSVILLDKELKIKARNSTENYVVLKTFIHSNEVFAIAYDGKELKRIRVDSALNVSGDNFVFECDAQDFCVIDYGDEVLVFATCRDGARFVTYNHNTGFTQTYFKDKARVLQILPVVASGEQRFVALLKDSDGIDAISLSHTLVLLESHRLSDARCAVAFAKNNAVRVVTDAGVFNFCSHLEPTLKTTLQSIGISKDYSAFSAAQGAPECMVATRENACDVLLFDGEKFVEIISLPRVENALFATSSFGNAGVFVAFDCNNDSRYTYMGFGKRDVFATSILTTQSS